MLTNVFFFHLFCFFIFIIYVYIYILNLNNDLYLYEIFKNDNIGWVDEVLRNYYLYTNEFFIDSFFLDWNPPIDFLPSEEDFDLYMSWRHFMYLSEYSRVFSLRSYGTLILDYFKSTAIPLEEYDCEFFVGSFYDNNFSKGDIEYLDVLVLQELFNYITYLENFFFDVCGDINFPKVFEDEDFLDLSSCLTFIYRYFFLLFENLQLNYVYMTMKFNFLSFIFILLTFIVFFVVWFYAFCVGISKLEFYIYIFIEVLSFLIFLVDNLLFFIIILEVSTIVLLFTYTGDRYRRFRSMSLLFYYTLASGLFLLLVFFVRDLGVTHFDNLLMFCVMLIGVFIKLPIYPFHLWLPEAHAEATTCGSLILAGVILKMGFYGFVYFVSAELLFFPYKNFIVAFLLFSSLFLLFAVYVQVDIKKIIAYSSVIHMQIAIAVFLMDSVYAYESALLIVINHGLVSVGLFVIASLYISMEGTRDIIKWNYSSNYLSKLFLFFILSNMSFPFTIGFWGEFLAVYSVLNMSIIFILLFILNQLIVVIYNLRLYWLVLSVVGPYYRLRGFLNYKVTLVLVILVFFNFILFFSVLHFLN